MKKIFCNYDGHSLKGFNLKMVRENRARLFPVPSAMFSNYGTLLNNTQAVAYYVTNARPYFL